MTEPVTEPVTGPKASGEAVTHPAFAPRRGAVSVRSWWARAWARALEEAAPGEAELRRARALARSGDVGAITVTAGGVVARVVAHRASGDVAAVAVRLPVLGHEGTQTLAELVAARPDRATRLLDGDLPHDLVEHADEAGVELLPFGGELEASCTCRSRTHPCVHALAVLHQVTWLLEGDPLVLLHLRGLPRDRLLARVRALSAAPGSRPPEGGSRLDVGLDVPLDGEGEDTLDTAVEAALRAESLLQRWRSEAEPGGGASSGSAEG